MALVKASGLRGLSAFLPEPDSAYTLNSASTSHFTKTNSYPPILPLTDTWQDADFSLEAVMRDQRIDNRKVQLRLWCLQLLSRYLYITGMLVPRHIKSEDLSNSFRPIPNAISHDYRCRWSRSGL